MALGWLWWRAWAPLVARGAELFRDRRGTWRHPASLCVAWRWATSTFILRGRCGTHGAGLPLVARLGAVGHPWRRGTFAWQVWHLATSTFVSRGRRGIWRHQPSFCVAGVVLMALGWLWWRAWVPLVARGASALLRGRLGTWWHLLSFHVAGVAFGDVNLRFAWQAWCSWRWAGCLVAHLNAVGCPWCRDTFPWQAWRLAISTFVSRGRRGAFHIHLHFAWQGWHLWHWAGSGRVSHKTLSHTIFHTHLCDTPSSTHHLCDTPSCHTPSFTHNFVTHTQTHNSHTHKTVSQTILSTQLFHTHTQLCHTLSFTHTHTQLCHTPSSTTLSHTIFHTHLCDTPSSTHHLCDTPSCHKPSFTHNFVTHTQTHKSHTHTKLCRTPSCQHSSFTHKTLSHTIFHTHTHATLSHTIFHAKLCHTPFFTKLCHTQSFNTQLCHTPSFTHTQLCHTPSLSPTTISHTQLCHTPFVIISFVIHFLPHTILSHTIFHTQLCHTPSSTTLSHTIFVTYHLSHTTLSHTCSEQLFELLTWNVSFMQIKTGHLAKIDRKAAQNSEMD